MTTDPLPPVHTDPSQTWQRSREHRVFTGVCGGIAEHVGLGPNSVRLILVVLSLVTLGGGLAAYVVAYLLMAGPNGEPAPLRSWSVR
jgi:phage shock protein C